MCVTLEITGLLWNVLLAFLLRLTAGGRGISSCGLCQRSSTHWMIRKTYLLGAPGRIVRRRWPPLLLFFFCKALTHWPPCAERRHPVGLSFRGRSLKARRPPFTWFFRIWLLRPACGTAVKSVRIIIRVSLLVRAQGDPGTGVSLYLPCPQMYVPRAGEGGLGRENSDFVDFLNSKLAHACA